MNHKLPDVLPDVLGFRAKIGVLVPATNTIVEPELAMLQLPGVTNHVSRMSRPKRSTTDLEHYRKVLGHSFDMDEAIDLLVACEPNAIVLGHSLDSLALGVQGAKDMQARMESVAGGVPVILPSLSLLLALKAIGGPRTLGILTPYMPPGDEACAAFFEDAGYKVGAIKGLQHPTPIDIATATPELLNAAVDEVNAPHIECIVKVGTNSSILGLVASIEKRIGKPVLAVNPVTYWAAMRMLKIQDRWSGFGTLLAAH